MLPAAAASAGELRNRFIKGYNVTRVSTEPLAMMMMMLGCWACQTEQDKRRKRRRGQEGIENAQRHGKHSRKLLDTFIFPIFFFTFYFTSSSSSSFSPSLLSLFLVRKIKVHPAGA